MSTRLITLLLSCAFVASVQSADVRVYNFGLSGTQPTNIYKATKVDHP